MKTLLILTVVISFNLAMAEQIPFSLPHLNIHNFMFQNGSAPYLQGELIPEERVPADNLAGELETRLIELDLLQRCI